MSFRPEGEIYTRAKWTMPMYRYLTIVRDDKVEYFMGSKC